MHRKELFDIFVTAPSNFPTGRPYNCCESILLALKDYLPTGHEIIPKIGTGIGAGVSLNGLLCGAVSSIALAIGIKYGRASAEENPQPVWNMVDNYVAEFTKKVWLRELPRAYRFRHKDKRRIQGVLR